jgi:hypothetical protein
MLWIPPASVVAAQRAFRQEHSGEGHKIEVKYEPFLADGKPTPTQREITACSCRKEGEGQMVQFLIHGMYLDRR